MAHHRPPPQLAPVAFPHSNALATDLKFGALCDLFDGVKNKRDRKAAVRKFFERAVWGRRFDDAGECVAGGPDVTTPAHRLGDVFQLFRLMMPGHDTERPPYGVSLSQGVGAARVEECGGVGGRGRPGLVAAAGGGARRNLPFGARPRLATLLISTRPPPLKKNNSSKRTPSPGPC